MSNDLPVSSKPVYCPDPPANAIGYSESTFAIDSTTISPTTRLDTPHDTTSAATTVTTDDGLTVQLPCDPPALTPTAARLVLRILLDAYQDKHGRPFNPEEA